MMFEWEKRFPNMQLIIKEFSHNDLEPMLLRGELDLIYTIGNDNPALRLFPIALEPVYLLVSEKNPLADCGELSVEDLKNERFLLYNGIIASRYERYRINGRAVKIF